MLKPPCNDAIAKELRHAGLQDGVQLVMRYRTGWMAWAEGVAFISPAYGMPVGEKAAMLLGHLHSRKAAGARGGRIEIKGAF